MIDSTSLLPELTHSLNRYDLSHPFAHLEGKDNIISITTSGSPEPMIIQGVG